MGKMTDYFEAKVLNIFNNTADAGGVTAYLALYLTDPTGTGIAGTEIAYTNYVRQPITLAVPSVSGNTVTTVNSTEITFAQATTALPTINYYAIMDAAIGGNMYVYVQLEEPLIIAAQQEPVVLAGADGISLSFSNNLSVAYKTIVFNILRGITATKITPYLALYGGDPNAGGLELAGASYARPLLTMSLPAPLLSGQSQITNTTVYEFPRALENWGSWGYTAVMNAVTSGTPVWAMQRSPAEQINKGFKAKGEISSLNIAIN